MGMQPFEQIVSEHGAMVLRVCRSLLDPVAADDAWSETFLAAMRAYPGLRADSNITGWLATIAYRKSIDQIRTAKRTAIPLDSVPGIGQITEPPEPLNDDLRLALTDLAPKQREAVVYRYLADLAYREIAELLDSTEPAVRRNAADGIARLRTHYQGMQYQGTHYLKGTSS
jgi:RNA polymerase sigma factor (sigma-70 family)